MEQIEFKKMISVIKKIDKDNVENIVAFMDNGDVIIGNINSFFVYRAGNKVKMINEETEAVVIPVIDFPSCGSAKHVAIDNDHVYITPTAGVSINFPFPQEVDNHSIGSIEAIASFLQEKLVPYVNTLGLRSFPSKMDLSYRIYSELKRQLLQFQKLKNEKKCIYITKEYIGATDTNVVNYVEEKGSQMFTISFDVLEAMKLFGTPFSMYISNFPDNDKQLFHDEKAPIDDQKQQKEDAWLPQIMLSNPRLDFHYTHTVKDLPRIIDMKAVYPIEKPLYTFMVNNSMFDSISQVGTLNACQFINFYVVNTEMFIWAKNDTEVVLSERLPVYSTNKTIKGMFKMYTSNLISAVSQTNDAYIKIQFHGMDRPLIMDDRILVMTTNYELDPDEMKKDVQEIFGE